MTNPRARDLGLDFPGEPGPKNALTDIPGVLVGHTTLIDDATTGYGRGPVRTGVTAILPRGRAVCTRSPRRSQPGTKDPPQLTLGFG